MGISYFDVWKKRMGNNGDIVESRLNNSKSIFNNSFKDDPSYRLAKLKSKENTEEIDLDTRIINNEENPLEKKIYVRPDTNISVGDYIVYPNTIYLVLKVETNLISPRADSTKCNQLLKWMYKGNLYGTQSIATNQTEYTLGQKILVSGIAETDSRFQVQLPYNNITKNIKIGQRFLFNDGAWRVTQTDRVSEIGLYSLLLGQDSINNEIDDVDNEIAGARVSKHTYTYDIPPSIDVEKDKSINLVYSIKDEKGNDFDYSLVTITNKSNLIQVDNNKGVISIKGLDIGTGSITLSIPSGEVSKDFVVPFEVKSVVPDKIEYTVTSSNGYMFIKMVGSQISVQKLVNGVADTTLKVDYKVPTNIQTLITNGSLSITTKSDNSIYIRNKSVTTPTTFVIEFFDKATGTKICESPTITLKGA